MMAKIQIANTAQTKAAFHHGSIVPYGIAANTIDPISAAKTPLLSRSLIFKLVLFVLFRVSLRGQHVATRDA